MQQQQFSVASCLLGEVCSCNGFDTIFKGFNGFNSVCRWISFQPRNLYLARSQQEFAVSIDTALLLANSRHEISGRRLIFNPLIVGLFVSCNSHKYKGQFSRLSNHPALGIRIQCGPPLEQGECLCYKW